MTEQSTSAPDYQTGLLFIVCGPSGVGKTSLGRALRARHSNLVLSVSATTRPIRTGEVDGTDYHFLSVPEFLSLRDQGAFAEWAEVHGNYYGTLRSAIDDAWRANHDVLFDIDYQGAIQLQAAYAVETVSVLVTPPSMSKLKQRLTDRGTDSQEVINDRLDAARHELDQYAVYDYILPNDVFDEALDDLEGIYLASLRRTVLAGPVLQALLDA